MGDVVVKRVQSNVHQLTFDEGSRQRLAMLSDVHWDNPHCDRELLVRHLDHCVKNNIPIHLNGDTFCLMQGRGDPRRSKNDIRPEHNTSTYIDDVVDDSIEWWSPYAHLLTAVGYGNHETGIIRHQETDVLQRFVQGLNTKNGTRIQLGGYGGWLVMRMNKWGANVTTTGKYYHGSGGGGIVTKGAINLTRAIETYEGMDFYTMGHIHENSSRNDVRETLDGTKLRRTVHKKIHLMITGTYKEEYGDGSGNFHVEKGRPIKPLGGRILDVSFRRDKSGKHSSIVKTVDSYQFAA